MYSNWASRSGRLVPSRVLLLACRLKLSRRSSRPTSFWPAAKPALGQRASEVALALADPQQGGLGIAADGRLHQLAQSLQQAGLRLHRRLASPARAADAAAEVVPPEAQFGQAAADGLRDTGRRSHRRYAAAACRLRLTRREQAPPPFVQEWRHRLEACSDARDIDTPAA